MKKLSLALLSSLAVASAAFACDPSRELAQMRAALAKKADAPKADLAKEHYQIGVFAHAHGLEHDARAEFKAAVAADPSHEAAHTALGEVRAGETWVTRDEAMAMKGLVQRSGAWILAEEAAILDLPAQEKAHRAEEQTKASKLLRAYGDAKGAARKFAVEALSGVADKYKFEPLAWGLRSKSSDVRLFAAAELGRLGNRRGLRPLLWRAIHDPDESVRTASVAAAKSIGDPNLIAPFVAALASPTDQLRVNAAQALGEAGELLGVKYLVYHYEAHGGGAPRVYYSDIKQLSFIQDFDVEVAQTAFIADPIIGTIQEGFVLDVQVIATSAEGTFIEREVVHAALRKLTGATDVKNEPGAWAAWWKDHGKDLKTASR